MVEEHTDDCWNLYNLMSEGDFVYGKCMRKVQKVENLSGGLKNVRKTLSLLLKVKVRKNSMFFQTSAFFVIQNYDYDPDSDNVRIQGINSKENKFCGMGQF